MGTSSGTKGRRPTRELRSNAPFPAPLPALALAASPQKLFNSVRKTILGSSESADLGYELISPSTGLQLATKFCEDSEIERTHPWYVTLFIVHSNKFAL